MRSPLARRIDGVMGDLGWTTELVARLGRPAENVWLVALGAACVGPFVALVLPRLSRVVGLAAASGAFALALAATVHQQTMLALGLLTVAVTGGFVASCGGWCRVSAGIRPGGQASVRASSVAPGRSWVSTGAGWRCSAWPGTPVGRRCSTAAAGWRGRCRARSRAAPDCRGRAPAPW